MIRKVGFAVKNSLVQGCVCNVIANISSMGRLYS